MGSFAPPGYQVRRVEAFPTEESADATRSRGSSIGLGQEALFVLGGEGAPFGFGNHLGAGP